MKHLLCFAVLLLAACAPQAAPVPTLMALPSLTPPPSDTPFPSETPLPSATFAPPPPSETPTVPPTPDLISLEATRLSATNEVALLTLAAMQTAAAASPTPVPTMTPSPTLTSTALPTSTPDASGTAFAQAFLLTASAVPFQPQEGDLITVTPRTVYAQGTVNLRACASARCDLVASVDSGTALTVNAMLNGQAVDVGNAIWYRTDWQGREAYVYSNLVTYAAPTSPAIISQPAQPVSPPSNPPASSDGCPGRSLTCASLTCAQAYACLRAGNRSLDRDRDGVPCESICPGG